MKRLLFILPFVLASSPAFAWDSAKSESPKWGSAELGGGSLTPTGSDVETVYGTDKREPVIHARAGVLLFSILDLGVAADGAQFNGHRVGTVGGQTSAEISRLTLIPISATGILRLDFFHHQPVVPFVGAGPAYVVWQERDPIDDKDVSGDKYGWTALGGLSISLRPLEPGRAADLDSWWGVNETFLNLEVSKTSYDRFGRGVDGLDLGHWSARASFMFEY